MKNILYCTAFFCAAAFSQVQAQSVSNANEMQDFVRKFMGAYHQQDVAVLQKMYTDDAVLIGTNGKEISGISAIGDFYSEQFSLRNMTLLLTQLDIGWSDDQHAFVAIGRYEEYGQTNVYDIKVRERGAYAYTMFKEKDTWKIARAELKPLVSILVYQPVKDFVEWKWAFEHTLPMRLSAGERSYEYGTLQSDPNTAYVFSEWTSVEAARSFFASQDFVDAMKEAGVTEKPEILILDRK